MSIQIEKSDITKFPCDAIVNPANSYGYMGGGVAGAIKRIGGRAIENEAIEQAPIPIGKAVNTTAGSLPCKYVIHAPTMKQPAMRISSENVEIATRAALKKASELDINTIAIPGIGTGVGGVPIDEAAKVMIKAAKEFENNFEKIFLICFNEDLVKAFQKYL